MENKKVNTGTGKRWIRGISVMLVAVLAITWIMPSVAQIMAGTAEETDPIARIYSMLTGTLEDPQTAEDYYELANIAIGQSNYEGALEYLAKARELADPADPAAIAEMWLKSASVYALQGDYENTKLCLASVLENDPASTQAVLLQAQIMIEEGRYSEAAAELKNYLELVPEDSSTRLTLAQLLESIGRYAEAAAEYKALHEANPASDAHLLNQLRCGFLNANYEETVAGFDAYLADSENKEAEYVSVAHFLRAACLMQMGSHTDAVSGFRAAMEAGYDAATCYEQIVLCSFDGGDFTGTVAAGEEMLAAQLTPATADVFNQRMGAALMQLGRYEEAIEYLSASIEINPDLAGSHYYRGISYLQMTKLEEAVADFTASIEREFLLQFCYYNRGVCHVQLLDYDSALNDFEQTLLIADDEGLIQGAKDILWQLVAYYENQAAIESQPVVQEADVAEVDAEEIAEDTAETAVDEIVEDTVETVESTEDVA